MTPLSKIEQEEMAKGNFALTFSVHKYNSYIEGRTLNVEEAARCVVLQSKWAASHELVSLPDTKQLEVDVKIITELDVAELGLLVNIEITELGVKPYRQQFIVNESESHWYFFDYSVASVSKNIEVGQGKTAVVAKYN